MGLNVNSNVLYNGFHEINVNSPSSSACRNNRAKFKLGVSLGRISVSSASSFRPVSNVDLLWRYFSSSLDNGGKLFLQLVGQDKGCTISYWSAATWVTSPRSKVTIHDDVLSPRLESSVLYLDNSNIGKVNAYILKNYCYLYKIGMFLFRRSKRLVRSG